MAPGPCAMVLNGTRPARPWTLPSISRSEVAVGHGGDGVIAHAGLGERLGADEGLP